MRIVVEAGPRRDRIVAIAIDWPGLPRGDKTEELALNRLTDYRNRYLPVATLAGLADQLRKEGEIEVIERYEGKGSTDFWGISFASSSIGQLPLSDEQLERQLSLLKASWEFFDFTGSHVSMELMKGLRGGGKNRDNIIRHTIAAEYDMRKKLGVKAPDQILQGIDLTEWRERCVQSIREYHAAGKPAKRWTLPYLIRHTAFHTLDYTWEMEERDLTPKMALEQV